MRTSLTRKNLTRLTVAGTVVAMATGVAVPAFAGTSANGAREHQPVSATPLTVDQLKARVDSWINARLAHLAYEADKIASSTRLTDAQKATAAAKIADRVTALNALKTKVDSETTTAAIKADLAAARLAALKSWVDDRIGVKLAHLAAKATRIASSTTLTDAQKVAAQAKIQARVDALLTLKAKVDAETTVAGVLADLKAAHGFFDFRDDRAKGHGKGHGVKLGGHGARGLDEPAATLLAVGRHAADHGIRLEHPMGDDHGTHGGHGGSGGHQGGGDGGRHR